MSLMGLGLILHVFINVCVLHRYKYTEKSDLSDISVRPVHASVSIVFLSLILLL